MPVPTRGRAEDAPIVFDLLVAVDHVDGSDTPVSSLGPSPAPGGATTPADNYAVVFTAPDLAAFAALFDGAFPTGATLVVPYGPHSGAYFVASAAALTSPWQPLPGLFAEPTPGYDGPESFLLFRRPDRWEWITEATEISYHGKGLNAGNGTVKDSLDGMEGVLDRWRWVSAISTDPGFDPQVYVGAGNGPVPALDMGTVTVGGDIASLKSDPTHAFIYFVEDDGSLTEPPPTDVFNPPGNGYRVSLNASGDPNDGATFMWISDDKTDRQRGRTFDYVPVTGRWFQMFTPTPI